MKKRSLIILLVAVLVGLVVIGAGTTYAWLTQEDEKVITYEVGEINYGITLEGEEEDAKLVVPGQDITPEITITNSSNIDTQLRVKFTIEKTSGNSEVWTIGTEDTNHLKLTLNTNWVYEEDGYYYYKGSSNEVADNKIAANTNPESIFTSLVINGNKVGNTQSGAQIKMTIKFEVKQADYVSWNKMTELSIGFGTGLPNA